MWAKSLLLLKAALPQKQASSGEGWRRQSADTHRNKPGFSFPLHLPPFLSQLHFPSGGGGGCIGVVSLSKVREQKIAAEINTLAKMTQLGYVTPPPHFSLLLPPTLPLSLPLKGPFCLHPPASPPGLCSNTALYCHLLISWFLKTPPRKTSTWLKSPG